MKVFIQVGAAILPISASNSNLMWLLRSYFKGKDAGEYT